MNKTEDGKNGNQDLKKRIIVLSVCAFIILISVFFYILSIYQYGKKPGSNQAEKKIFSIHTGQNIHTIAEQLQHLNIIQNPSKFKMLSRVKGLNNKLKTGEYELSPSMTPNEILDIIVSGKSMLYRITVPEGCNLHQVSLIIEKSELISCGKFYQTATDPKVTREMGIPADTFEGYLFPDTYLFPKKATPEIIIATMLNRFKEIFTEDWKNQADRLGFSIHEIVIISSMIEKETGSSYERPIISSVFHNRLQKGMRLESDPTVIYAIQDFDGNLTKKHLQTLTPYNTYKIIGLPLGPIANPGKKALEAALYPADTDYLFFVSKRDGTHQFSNTIDEHNRAVQIFQIQKR
ncbi:MAG: endolytic transglycosylase MltG [Desulfobacterium sp.]|nr:endolytic transglycosylase MltG [Desulfobacterium sp.]